MSKYTFNPAAQLGISIVLAIVGFAAIGIWLDKKFNTGILFLFTGISLAFIYIGYEIWKLIKWSEKDQENNKSKNDQSDNGN